MGRIVVAQFVSVDGVIEDPVGMEELGRGAWTSPFDSGAEGAEYVVDVLLGSEAMLLGRRTYEGYAAAWPAVGGEYADKINSMPKYVVSTTLEDPPWENSTVIRCDVPAQAADLRRRLDGNILVHGSGRLVHTLMENELVDEWQLMVFPVVVGAGKRCFGDPGQAVALQLLETRPLGPDGIVLLTYAPSGVSLS
jgi:dihydrofolate reductase